MRYRRGARLFHTATYLLTFVLIGTGWWIATGHDGEPSVLADASGIPLERTVAVGDGANDLQMLGRARLGVAFCAKPVVRRQADVAIDVPDLSAVLPLLGLRG